MIDATAADQRQADSCLRSVVAAIEREGGNHDIVIIAPPNTVSHAQDSKANTQVTSVECSNQERCLDAALRSASNEIILLLDSFTTPEPDFLHPILSAFDAPEIFAVVPTVARAEADSDREEGGVRGDIRNGELRLWHPSFPEDSPVLEPILAASSGPCAYRRSAFQWIGGFDPIYSTLAGAQLDLGFRAWSWGWSVVHSSASRVHRIGANPSHVSAPDLATRDEILFAWSNLRSPRLLSGYQAATAIRLASDALIGQMNLRPLRFALSQVPQVVLRRMNSRSLKERPATSVFQLSSRHGYIPPSAKGVEVQGSREIASSHYARHASDSYSKPLDQLRMLVVCPQLPYPPAHGAAVRMWNLIKAMSVHHQVDVLSFSEPGLSSDEVAASVEQLKRYCGEVRTVPRRPFSNRPSILDRTIHIEMFDSPGMRDALAEMVGGGDYDVIQYDKTEMGQYLLPKPAPVQLLVEHIVFYYAYQRQFLTRGRVTLGRLVEYAKLRRHELNVCRRFDGLVTMSPADTAYLRARLPEHPCIEDIPNGVDKEYYRYNSELSTSKDLLFIGNFDHSPNVDGIRFFLQRVFPLVKQAIPEVRLFVVGPGPYHTLPEVAGEPATIPTGFVDDTRPYMASCSVFVAPILAGSGTRLKILEAMSAGIPIVSTTIGAEGLNVRNGEEMLIADEPSRFASAIVSLLQDPSLRERLRANARSSIEGGYSWDRIADRMGELCARLVAERG